MNLLGHHSLLMCFKSVCLCGCLLTRLLRRAGSKHCAPLHCCSSSTPSTSKKLNPGQWAGSRQRCATITKPFHRCLVSAHEWGRRWDSQESVMLQYKHLSLLSTPTYLCHPSSPAFPCYIIPFPLCICCPAWKFSHLSSSLQAQQLQFPIDSMTGFPPFPHSSGSPGTGLHESNPIVTVPIICA